MEFKHYAEAPTNIAEAVIKKAKQNSGVNRSPVVNEINGITFGV